MLKLENSGTFFSLQYLYKMNKTLIPGGYHIGYIMVTIFVRCSMIADKIMSVKRIEALETLDDNFFFVPFYILILYIFVFLSSYFLSFGIDGFY